MNADNIKWDIEADVVVLGSGGAALTSAITAHDSGAKEVIIVEKSGMVGGTTAMSGGMLWIPNNHHQQENKVSDSWDKAVTYLDSLAPDMLDPDTLEAFLESGPEMVRYLEEHTPVRFHLYEKFPDYHPDTKGAMQNGSRSLDNDVFPFEQLGNWATRVNPPKIGAPSPISMREAMYGGAWDPETLAERRKSDCRGQGQALIGALLKGVLDRNIPIHFEHRARKLYKDGSRVVGVVAEQAGSEVHIRARKGVVIATGGFEWNKELVQTFLRGPMTGPNSVPENEGDGLIMAMEVGAKLGNMSNAWWMMSRLQSAPQHRDAKPVYLLCQNERTLPGSIMVNRSGKRFVDEAVNYNALGRVLHTFDAKAFDYPNLPYWLIFDSRFRSKYPIFGLKPKTPVPPEFHSGETLTELAKSIGLDSKTLEATVAHFNAGVLKGHDDEFNRGDDTYGNFWGDQSFEPPHCTLGVLNEPPFFAVELEAGAIGTNGGPKTNGNAQVLDWEGNIIEGLYAAGNAMASVMTRVYAGAGGTLGPGLTFGFIAGRHAASGGKTAVMRSNQ
ncbi:MAG: FAD-binding dehydrogenase [Gammaproteobacteria bacterium]|jgi:succinate dehydrogenase/fumarate reductase flavoprotein subunit|nr:FAD-binding dehydrogenase [Gammaproteobacteria bacterium]|tara:strand:- start:1390 stop:3057 length:1668 start_codon:yes stop_codon:yes gene_type:complete